MKPALPESKPREQIGQSLGDSWAANPAVLTTIGVWFASAAMVAWFEFGIFWNLPLLLFAMNLNSFDQLLILGSLLARTLLITSPLPVFLILSNRQRWKRRWKLLAWGAYFLTLSWIVIDCGLQCVTGANLWHYVQKAASMEDFAVGGDVTLLLGGIRTAITVIAFQIGAFAICLHWAVTRLNRSRWKAFIPGLNRAAVVTIVLLLPAVVMGRNFVSQRHALEQLYETITLRTWIFHPDRIAEYGKVAFGKDCQTEFQSLEEDLRRLFESSVCKAGPASNVLQAATENTDGGKFVLTGTEAFTETETLSEGQSQPPHIILLLTESLRFDALTAEHMPELFRRSAKGFVSHQHSTNSNCSEYGAFSALYGRYALCYEKTLTDQIPSSPMTRLKQLGYERRMINSCSVNFSRMDEFLSELNFDSISTHAAPGNPWHDNDRKTLNEAVRVIRGSTKPQFVFSILMATHYSYDYPEEYDSNPPHGSDPPDADADSHQILEDRYWKAVTYLDRQISQLVDSLEGTNTIVIVTGDHGESFLDDGFLCHGTRLSNIQTRTPLLMIGPEIPARVSSRPSGHIDLMPTIMHLANRGEALPVDLNGPGRNLLSENSQRAREGQLVVHSGTSKWEVALETADGVLSFKTNRFGENLRVLGFLDENGRVDRKQQRDASQIRIWKDRLQSELRAGAGIHSAP